MLKPIGDKSFIDVPKKSFKQIEKQEFDTLAKKLDAREKVFDILIEIESKNLPIPQKYTNDPAVMLNYESYKTFGSWRKNQRVVIKLRNTARKNAKNVTAR